LEFRHLRAPLLRGTQEQKIEDPNDQQIREKLDQQLW
jgi:hypothetical protein